MWNSKGGGNGVPQMIPFVRRKDEEERLENINSNTA